MGMATDLYLFLNLSCKNKQGEMSLAKSAKFFPCKQAYLSSVSPHQHRAQHAYLFNQVLILKACLAWEVLGKKGCREIK